jgi:hypothetical protein
LVGLGKPHTHIDGPPLPQKLVVDITGSLWAWAISPFISVLRHRLCIVHLLTTVHTYRMHTVCYEYEWFYLVSLGSAPQYVRDEMGYCLLIYNLYTIQLCIQYCNNDVSRQRPRGGTCE